MNDAFDEVIYHRLRTALSNARLAIDLARSTAKAASIAIHELSEAQEAFDKWAAGIRAAAPEGSYWAQDAIAEVQAGRPILSGAKPEPTRRERPKTIVPGPKRRLSSSGCTVKERRR